MSNLREIMMQILDQLPDDATLEEVQYHLYVRQKIERGMADERQGRWIDDEEMKRRIESWRTAARKESETDSYEPPQTG